VNRYGLFLHYLYVGLLSLYPSRFRTEFGSEMQAVFDQALVDAAVSGCIAGFFVREVRDWPLSVLHAHLLERKGLNMNTTSGEKPISWQGILVGIGLFLLAIFWQLSDSLVSNLGVNIALIVLLIFMVLVMLIGIFKGLPRWSLPSFGLLLGGFIMYGGLGLLDPILGGMMSRFVQIGNEINRYAWQAMMSGVYWLLVFLLSLIFILIFALLPSLRPLYRRIRKDWTLVSFMLYGAVLFSFFINWDEYTHEQAFVAACNLFLAIGAGGYLLSKTKTSRLAWLLGGAALAMITMSVGKFILVPLQDWPMWFQWHSKGVERWFESLRSLIELGWMLLALIAPSVLNLLPLAKEPAVEIPDSTKRAVENPVGSASPS